MGDGERSERLAPALDRRRARVRVDAVVQLDGQTGRSKEVDDAAGNPGSHDARVGNDERAPGAELGHDRWKLRDDPGAEPRSVSGEDVQTASRVALEGHRT